MIIPKIKDSRGCLMPLDFSHVPFCVKRVFFVTDAKKGEKRGGHAHHQTMQLLVCIKGMITVSVEDEYGEIYRTLGQGDTFLVGPLKWDYQIFETGNDVLAVLCSTEYEESDYIRDRKEFEKINAEKRGAK